MNATPTPSLEAKVDALTERVDLLLDRQRAFSELIDESGPILSAMMQAGTEQLGSLEERGYFAFGRSTLRLLDRVVSSYTADDVDQLGDAVVGILDTVRNVTQPDVLAMANEATDVLHNADTLEPVSVLGAIKKSRDDDVQRGMAVLLEVLRHVGRASNAVASEGSLKQRRLSRHLAPRRSRRPMARPAAAPAAAPAPAPAPVAPVATPCVPGFEVNAEGFLLDPATWTREYAAAVAGQSGLELTDEHWVVLDYMRATYLDTGKSPNIRKIAKGSGVGTNSVYRLFKKAPGKTAARIAGIPKPVGCI